MRSLLIASVRVAEVVRAQTKVGHFHASASEFHIFKRNVTTSKFSDVLTDDRPLFGSFDLPLNIYPSPFRPGLVNGINDPRSFETRFETGVNQ